MAAAPTVEIKKGNTVLSVTAVSIDSTDSTAYLVNVADASTTNPLYATGETSVNLSVKVKDFKDTANYIGSEFNGSVSLTKDSTAPAVVSNSLNAATSVATGNRALSFVSMEQSQMELLYRLQM